MNYEQELKPEVREKMKKNLVYVGIFSIIMLFAGLTSGYYVSMGKSFWLKYPMPTGFYLSTLFIALSSLSFWWAIQGAKKDKQGQLRGAMAATLLFGGAFLYFQFQGYGELVDKGVNPVNDMLVTNGRYGDYYEIKYKGNLVAVDGNEYLINGKPIGSSDFKKIQAYFKQFEKINRNAPIKIKEQHTEIELYYIGSPVLIKDRQLYANDSTQLTYADEIRLSELAINVRDKRGDFFAHGTYGKDFTIYYSGKALAYKNRQLQYNGTALKPHMQLSAMQAADSASAYLYLITFVHLLHVLIALLYLVKVAIASFSGKFSSQNTLSLRLSSIFWHFLGLLWLYLLVFLNFIH
jgi:cytochrome c oxidase subunit III